MNQQIKQRNASSKYFNPIDFMQCREFSTTPAVIISSATSTEATKMHEIHMPNQQHNRHPTQFENISNRHNRAAWQLLLQFIQCYLFSKCKKCDSSNYIGETSTIIKLRINNHKEASLSTIKDFQQPDTSTNRTTQSLTLNALHALNAYECVERRLL